MKATIDIPDELYRQVKAKSALEGRPVREVTVELFRRWLAESGAEPQGDSPAEQAGASERPPWYGALSEFAGNAGGRHDMKSVRRSIARGRARQSARKDTGNE